MCVCVCVCVCCRPTNTPGRVHNRCLPAPIFDCVVTSLPVCALAGQGSSFRVFSNRGVYVEYSCPTTVVQILNLQCWKITINIVLICFLLYSLSSLYEAGTRKARWKVLGLTNNRCETRDQRSGRRVGTRTAPVSPPHWGKIFLIADHGTMDTDDSIRIYPSVAVTPTPVRVPILRPLVPSVTSVLARPRTFHLPSYIH